MANKSIICYAIPSLPLPLLLPVECVAAVVKDPQIDVMTEAPAKWMRGHATWNNQRLPILSYAGLHDEGYDESQELSASMVVLNPIPNAVRKAYSGLLCHGELKQIGIDDGSAYIETPENMDKRYVEAVIDFEGISYIIPKLAALEVAFSYF